MDKYRIFLNYKIPIFFEKFYNNQKNVLKIFNYKIAYFIQKYKYFLNIFSIILFLINFYSIFVYPQIRLPENNPLQVIFFLILFFGNAGIQDGIQDEFV